MSSTLGSIEYCSRQVKAWLAAVEVLYAGTEVQQQAVGWRKERAGHACLDLGKASELVHAYS